MKEGASQISVRTEAKMWNSCQKNLAPGQHQPNVRPINSIPLADLRGQAGSHRAEVGVLNTKPLRMELDMSRPATPFFVFSSAKFSWEEVVKRRKFKLSVGTDKRECFYPAGN